MSYEHLKRQFLATRELLVRLNDVKTQAEIEASRLRVQLISAREDAEIEKDQLLLNISQLTSRNKELLDQNEELRLENAVLSFALNAEVDAVIAKLTDDAAAKPGESACT